MSSRRVSPHALIDRRRLLSAVSVMALLPAFPVAARQQGGTPAAVSGEWTYTDDAGVIITRPATPERIVAYVPLAAALWDFGVRPVGIYGAPLRPDGTREVYAGNLDIAVVESLGEVYGELDLEQLAALQPDLIVNDKWVEPADVWGLEPDTIELINAIAPIANIEFVERPITDTIASVENLAEALGADLSAPEVVAAKAAFFVAEADLKTAIAEKPGLTVMFAAGTPEGPFWVGNPLQLADVMYVQQLGLDVVQPEDRESYSEELSWEQAARYPADLILLDARQWSSTGEELQAKVPTFASLPAMEAGQFGPWDSEYVPSYVGFTPVVEALAAAIRAADPDIV